jgi:uncharacterized protein (TIGR02466 family)
VAFKEPDVRVLFPVPMLTFRLDGAEALNARLLDEISRRRAEEPGVERSNRYGWHSENDLFDREEPAQAELARELKAMLASATERLMPDAKDGFEMRQEGWVNVSELHAFNAPHDHPGAFWSGCYYINVPLAEDGEDKLSGAIEFVDPRGSIGSNGMIEVPFTRSKFTVRPAPGSCMIWPSFVKHWVHPNRSREERVTSAFNAWFVRDRSGEV